jgi:hypothetical protein
MNATAWREVLRKATIGSEDWFWYSCWLRDEEGRDDLADGLLWLVAAGHYPHYRERRQWTWAYSGSSRCYFHSTGYSIPPHCLLPDDVFSALPETSRYSLGGARIYSERVDAMLGAAEAAAACGKTPSPGEP